MLNFLDKIANSECLFVVWVVAVVLLIIALPTIYAIEVLNK